MDRIDIVIPGIPIAKGRPCFSVRGGHVHTYTPQKTREYEERIQGCFLRKYGADEAPIFQKGVPLRIDVTCYFPVPKSASIAIRTAMEKGGIQMTKRPDLDNLQKCWDALILDKKRRIGYAMEDDSQVVEVHATKCYSNTPRTEIRIERLKGETK